MRAPSTAINGVVLEGFMTTPLPAMSAGMASPMLSSSGKFQGVIMPITPRGL